MPVDYEHIALMDLCRGQQSGNWIDHVPLNGALQMARSVALVGAFLKKERAPLCGDSK
jgi:hypothetical protein